MELPTPSEIYFQGRIVTMFATNWTCPQVYPHFHLSFSVGSSHWANARGSPSLALCSSFSGVLVLHFPDIIGYFKGSFNRDRPFEVDSSINTLPSETNKSRSYPSGHATQSRLVARYMADRNPVHAEEILRAGNECGLGRVKAGFHYMSDYHMGNLLGEKLFIFMNRESDGS